MFRADNTLIANPRLYGAPASDNPALVIRRDDAPELRRDHQLSFERVWDTGMLDLVWTSDITYLPTGQGWIYLCAVRDGCSRRVIGWAMADHLRTELVTAALNMAVAFRGLRPPSVVFHADRGTQGGFNWSSQRPSRRWVWVGQRVGWHR
jgi:transposase InsO family protein